MNANKWGVGRSTMQTTRREPECRSKAEMRKAYEAPRMRSLSEDDLLRAVAPVHGITSPFNGESQEL